MKFFDAKETDGRRSAQMLEMVCRLYAVEDEAKEQVAKLMTDQPDATAAQQHELIRALRQEKSSPILAEIKTWLDAEKELVLPRSPMGGAITYVLNQWAALNRYVEQGYLQIDNNVAERAVKRVAIGRKNWLFAGHDESGTAHAILWSLLASAERHGLNPKQYLTSVWPRSVRQPSVNWSVPAGRVESRPRRRGGSGRHPSQLHKPQQRCEDAVALSLHSLWQFSFDCRRILDREQTETIWSRIPNCLSRHCTSLLFNRRINSDNRIMAIESASIRLPRKRG